MTNSHDGADAPDFKLFSACFVALVATAFSFMLRIFLMDTWADEFGLDNTQKGTIFGAGLWPFGVSIVLFSLVLDRIGYRKAMAFSFICHIGFVAMTIMAGRNPESAYQYLYWGSVIGALGNGTVEAVINPLIATVFHKEKTKWLNILHAGWPGGLVVTGIVLFVIGDSMVWQSKIGLILIPTLIYGVMMMKQTFPVSERVTAGVSDREMLAEVGWGGFFIAAVMICMELLGPKTGMETNVLGFTALGMGGQLGVAAALAAVYGFFARSFGRPMYVFLLLVMLLLATTELGTDSWIKGLMGPAMTSAFGIDAGWVLVYTASIMLVLRIFCGPIVAKLQPLGLLAASSATVCVGILALSVLTQEADPSALIVFLAATIYGMGQTFFWPTTLGFVSEQFPRGGAMTINVIAGVGMLGVGVLGSAWLGNIQDTTIVATIEEADEALAKRYVDPEMKSSIFGDYQALDADAAMGATGADKEVLDQAQVEGKATALRKVVILPLLMLLAYLGLMSHFRRKGGYKPVELTSEMPAKA
jgi:MFS family permease